MAMSLLKGLAIAVPLFACGFTIGRAQDHAAAAPPACRADHHASGTAPPRDARLHETARPREDI